MIISKSLYKEYCQFPKLARWHVNNKKVYGAIQEDQYGAMNGEEIGDSVEQMVRQIFDGKTIVDVTMEWFSDYHARYHQITMDAMKTGSDIYYQAWFLVGDVYTRTDFLVKNSQGTYDIVEVKSITSPLTTTKIPTLKPDLLCDVIFQHYVVKKALGDKYSGRAFVYYLNKEFIKQWPINPQDIISILEVTEYLDSDENIEQVVDAMKKSLQLDEQAFSSLHPFDGSQYFLYHGEKPEKWTIFSIPRITQAKKKVLEVLQTGRTKIAELTESDIALLGDGWDEEKSYQKFVRLYQQWYTVDKEAIKTILGNLAFPLFFYDYETICTPIPILDGSWPWQQFPVQYSLHKMDADGTIIHKECIIQSGETTNKRLVDQLVTDIDSPQWTCIVWNKAFENSVNTNMGVLYPEYKEFFEKVNAQTFDLMEIFRDMHYFHPDFQWSASIKKVLPVLTDITYDWLAVPHGWVAMDILQQIATGKMIWPELETTVANLLEYCKQDTWAMVAIYQRLLKDIK